MARGRRLKSEELRAKKQLLLADIEKLDSAVTKLENEVSVSSYENWKEGKAYDSARPDLEKHRVKRQRLQDFLTKLNDEVSQNLKREQRESIASLDKEILRIDGLHNDCYKKSQKKERELAEIRKVSAGFGLELQELRAKKQAEARDNIICTVKIKDVDEWLDTHFCIEEKKLRDLRSSDVKRNNLIAREKRTNVDVVLGYDLDYCKLSGIIGIKARERRV